VFRVCKRQRQKISASNPLNVYNARRPPKFVETTTQCVNVVVGPHTRGTSRPCVLCRVFTTVIDINLGDLYEYTHVCRRRPFTFVGTRSSDVSFIFFFLPFFFRHRMFRRRPFILFLTRRCFASFVRLKTYTMFRHFVNITCRLVDPNVSTT